MHAVCTPMHRVLAGLKVVTCVDAVVALELAAFLESLVTLRALVGRGLEMHALARGVCLQVFLQVSRPFECLLTHLPTDKHKSHLFSSFPTTSQISNHFLGVTEQLSKCRPAISNLRKKIFMEFSYHL